ncbi:MAG: HD domain-containing phosphohydrolase [Syntrophales bacterium]
MMEVMTAEAMTGTGQKKILIVDDYIASRELISEALCQGGSYDIREAEDGFKALQLFQQEHFDLVISDIMMPGMSGMELLKRISEINPETAVIMITAYPETDLTVSAIKRGAVDFLAKPFKIDDLLFKVNIYLREQTLLGMDAQENKETSIELKNKTRELSLQGYIYDSIENTFGDNKDIFEKIADMAMNVVEGESCTLLLYDADEDEFRPQIIKNGHALSLAEKPDPSRLALFKKVVTKKEGITVRATERPEKMPALMCVPLMIRDHVFGVLCIQKRSNREAFSEKDLHYIVSLTKRASLNLENKILYESIFNNILETFKSLIASIQARDFYTEEHSLRVTKMAVRLARTLKCSEQEIESLKIAGTLHDIGKIAIPDQILLKIDKLTAAEYTVIQDHPIIGENILKPMLLFDREREIILHHHERWDGTGYPHGLSGNEIPYLSRILSVADSFDAMITDRPYRKAMSIETALDELKRNRFTQFDPEILHCFLDTFPA